MTTWIEVALHVPRDVPVNATAVWGATQLLQTLGSRGYSGSKQYGQTVLSRSSPLDEIMGGVALANTDRNDDWRYAEAEKLVAKTAGLEPGASGLLINGRGKFPSLLLSASVF